MKYDWQAGISLLLIFAMLSGCRSQNIPKHSESYSFKWEPVYYKGRNIIKVGNCKLLFPILLPDKIKPLGDIGLVCEDKTNKVNITRVDLFFKDSQEKEVRQWATTFKGIHNKAMRGKPLYHTDTFNRGLDWEVMAASDLSDTNKYTDVSYVFIGEPFPKNKEIAIKDAKEMSGRTGAFMSAVLEHGSPVIGEKRLISLNIQYRKFYSIK